jgi:ABC-type lipoprotein release transport system permease subunit
MSMGARPAQILRIFTLEGLGIGIVGALLGAAIGVGLVSALQQIPQPSAVPGRAPEPLFPAFVSSRLVLTAMASALCISVLAGVLPARQASRLDPVEALRRG